MLGRKICICKGNGRIVCNGRRRRLFTGVPRWLCFVLKIDLSSHILLLANDLMGELPEGTGSLAGAPTQLFRPPPIGSS